MEDRNTETNSNAAVSGLINILPSLSEAHIRVQELLENERAIVSATKECTSVEDRVMEKFSKAAVRRLILILSSPSV